MDWWLLFLLHAPIASPLMDGSDRVSPSRDVAGVLRLFVNGKTQADTRTRLAAIDVTTPVPLFVGSFFNGAIHNDELFAGHIDDARMTNGVARWTSDFTPPDFEAPTQGP